MPPVRQIDKTNGIQIVTHDQTVNSISVGWPTATDADDMSAKLTTLMQLEFQNTYARNSVDADHRWRQNPPTLHVWERRAGGNIIVTRMWVAVHVFTYPITGPDDYTIKCQNKEEGPITGDWWL
jgi:hypothetical protein